MYLLHGRHAKKACRFRCDLIEVYDDQETEPGQQGRIKKANGSPVEEGGTKRRDTYSLSYVVLDSGGEDYLDYVIMRSFTHSRLEGSIFLFVLLHIVQDA